MLIGYARVSTQDQNLDLQQDALASAGCEKIFIDHVSGAQAERVGLDQALEYMRPGDTLVVWKLDRLGRSLRHLVETIQLMVSKDIGFKSLQENIDTTTSGGKLVFHLFAALAEFERAIIRDRTHAGLAAARARGRKGGRPTVMNEQLKQAAELLRADRSRSITDICKTLGISRATFYRHTRP